jgi:hypothetical protein
MDEDVRKEVGRVETEHRLCQALTSCTLTRFTGRTAATFQLGIASLIGVLYVGLLQAHAIVALEGGHVSEYHSVSDLQT